MQNNKIQIKNPVPSIIGNYEPEGSSLLTTYNPRWVGGWAVAKRNERRRNISTTIGRLLPFGCPLLIQIYVFMCTFV